MLGRDDIAALTTAKSLERGQALCDEGNAVEGRSFTRLGDSCEISARVASTSGIRDSFRSTLIVDKDCTLIQGHECDCPAASRTSSLCKHCVALGLDFLNSPFAYEGFLASEEAQTSRSLAAFMGRQPRSLADQMGTPVGLQMELTHDFGNWTASFTLVGTHGSYVMADITAFADAVLANAWRSYGQKLAFVHRPSSFREDVRALALLIASIVQERRFNAGRPSKNLSASQPAAIRRTLPLTSLEVVELLKAAGDAPLSFVDTARSLHLCNLYPIEGDPYFELRIVRDAQGYSIVRDEDIIAIAGGEDLFVLQDGQLFHTSVAFAKAGAFLTDVYGSAENDLFIADDDASLFCSTVLPLLEEAFPLSIPPELELQRPREGSLEFYFDKTGRGEEEAVELTVKVTYGTDTFFLMEPAGEAARSRAREAESAKGGALQTSRSSEGTTLELYRDDALEGSAFDLAAEYFNSDMRLPLSEVERAGSLLYGGLARFQSAGAVFTTPDFDRLLTHKKARIHLGLSLVGDLIALDIRADDLEKEELHRLLNSYHRRRRFHRLKDGALASLEDMEIRELDSLLSDLALSSDDLLSEKIELPTYRAYILDREYAEAFRDESFTTYIERLDGPELSPASPPSSLASALRSYQAEGFQWLSRLSALGFGGILADEMGLGKSLQMIALLLALKEQGASAKPALIVCPASLVYNWAGEFEKFAPMLAIVPIEGQRQDRRRARKERADAYIISYDMARMDIEELEAMDFSTIVLDEAQYIKNHATKTARAVKHLKGQHRFALTGTPIENRLSEIWSIFDFLMPGFLGTYESFRKRFELDILGGDEAVAEHLRSLIAPFVLRRMKDAVLQELPAKQESIIRIPMGEEQRALYFATEQHLREDLHRQKQKDGAHLSGRESLLKVDVLAELMRLRQISLDPSLIFDNFKEESAKTRAILELLSQAMASGEKSLVFSQFTSYLTHLQKELERRDIPYYLITGATSKKQRIELVTRFNGDDVPVFLVSLKAGGTGLNLIGASTVIHADPWWNAAAINQATDRAHRIGQKEMVSVYKVIAKDTIEERIQALQEKKEQLADSIIDESSPWSLSQLSSAELERLFFG